MSEKVKKEIFEWIKVFALAIVFAFLITQFIKPTLVRGDSMYSTLEEGDYLIINRMAYKFGDPQRGDIIVFESDLQQDDGTSKDLVKRVIGVGGDTVKIENSKVYVNGTELDEPYIDEQITEGNVDTVVPEGTVFVLGDNRDISLDSRYEQVGFINESDILGKVFVRLYPFNKIGLLE
ncbi:signal peptidase I [Terrisporobacter sp.]|uniref:signal peptidase I n=1 Tax=Terrisporobacter sp. TaxID=1965305 RepID=UPI002635DEE3|nr:signal peptidase I [Terrisporobacter sp.]